MTTPITSPPPGRDRPPCIRCRRWLRLVQRLARKALLIALLAVTLVAGSPNVALAADTDPINAVVGKIRVTVMAVLAGYATLTLTIALLRYTSGEPGEVERGKHGIRNAVIGYAGALLAPVVVTIVGDWVTS